MMPEPTQILNEHKRVLATEILRRGGNIRVRVWGTSMLPVIWPGDMVEVENAVDEFRIGNVVLFERDKRFFVHRLISRDRERWISRGDALWRSDCPALQSELLGKVTVVRRPDTNTLRSLHLSALKRLVGLVLGECGLIRNLVLRLRTHKKRQMASTVVQAICSPPRVE